MRMMNTPENDQMLQQLRGKLPAVPGIGGRLDYRNSAVLVPLCFLAGEWRLLFEERTAGIRQGGEVCFPGGFMDFRQGETPEEAAVRETEEELGLGAGRIRLAGRLDTVIGPAGMLVEPVVGLLDLSALEDLRPNPAEVARVFTVPLNWFRCHRPEMYTVQMVVEPFRREPDGKLTVTFPARELGVPEQYQHPWPGTTIHVPVYRTPEAVVWGITARIVIDLVGRLEQT